MKRIAHIVASLLVGALPFSVWADEGATVDKCAYLNNDEVAFKNVYARLVNRGPNMLAVYGIVTNNDDIEHVLTAVSTPKAKMSSFNVYRQTGGAGDITAQPIDSITLPKQGGTYVWQLGGNHIALQGFDKKTAAAKLTFGTTFDPNQTIPITFTFADGCTKTLNQVPIRDRMND